MMAPAMASRSTSPAYVQFYPTLRCDAACDFCFNRGLAPNADVTVADFERLLDRLLAAGVRTVDLLGGEPTLHPRLAELVSAVAARGMRSTLSTNGRGDPGLLERLEDRFGGGTLRVGVSVNEDDIPERLERHLCSRMPIVKSLCRRDGLLPAPVRRHLGRPGAEYSLIFRDPLTAADLAGCLSYPEYVGRLEALRRVHPGAGAVACGGFVPGEEDAALLARVRCPAGTTKLSVLPDGSVFPCYLLFSRQQFRLGNLLTDAFDAIWGHARLEFFRSFAGNRCPRRDCAYHARCHGGCPAVSLLVAGDLEAPDPRCVPVPPGAWRH